MSEEKQRLRIKVDIMGKEYRFISNTQTSVDYIRRISKHVDEHMRKIFKNQPSLDTARIAVLSAVNIADEYFKLKSKFEQVNSRNEEKVASESNSWKESYEKLQAEKEQQVAENSNLQAEFVKLQEEYSKLQAEFNDWLKMMDQDSEGS